MYLEVSANILRDHHEVRVVVLYEVDEVLLLLVRDDDLLPLLFLQSETGKGVFLQELHPDSLVSKSLLLGCFLPGILGQFCHVADGVLHFLKIHV